MDERLVERVRLFQVRQVAGGGQRGQLGAGYGVGQGAQGLGWRHA